MEITIVSVVWLLDYNNHKILGTFALKFFKNY